MTSLAIALLLQISTLPSENISYAEAYRIHKETGRPLVVLVGAEWCPACRSMKQSTIPSLKSSGGLDEVVFVEVNTDQQSSLANRITGGGAIPQMVMYYKTEEGAKRQKFVGARGVDSVRGFLSRGVQANSEALSKEEGEESVNRQAAVTLP